MSALTEADNEDTHEKLTALRAAVEQLVRRVNEQQSALALASLALKHSAADSLEGTHIRGRAITLIEATLKGVWE